jgi:hypothetical protein
METLKYTLDQIEGWMVEAVTEPNLLDCIADCTYDRRGHSMTEICRGLGPLYMQLAQDQDTTGWRCFMEEMICKRMSKIQHKYHFW